MPVDGTAAEVRETASDMAGTSELSTTCGWKAVLLSREAVDTASAAKASGLMFSVDTESLRPESENA